MIGRILRRRRRLLAALAALGAALGVLSWLILPASFESTSTVLLQGPRDESQVRTEAQIATSRVVVDRAAAALSWDAEEIPDDAVTAEVSDGSVIKIIALAGTPSEARRFAQQVTEAYMTFSTEIANRSANATARALSDRREKVERRVEELEQAIDAGTGTDLQALRATRTKLLQELTGIEGRIVQAEAKAAVGRANMRVIEAPEEPKGPTTPSLLLLAAGGVVLVPVLGTAVLVARRLSDQRLRRRSEIASALGAPVLGTVQASPDWAPEQPEARGWKARIRRLLDSEPPPLTPPDPALDDLRYRRVLDRLRAAADRELRLLVIAADDDTEASGAVARLAAVAGEGGRPVSVVTDDPRLATARQVGAADEHPVEALARLASNRSPATVLRVQAVPAARPTVPSSPDVSGVLVVVTSGTRTSWELLSVAEACQDAALPIRGAIVVVPPGADEDVERDSGFAAPGQPAASAGQLNGHAGGVKV